MINWCKEFFKKHDSRFPKEVKRYWYCGRWQMHVQSLRDNDEYDGDSLDSDELESPARDKVAFNPFRTGHACHDTSNLVDGLIPAIRVDDEIGLYEQVGEKYRKTSFYDGAMWDDGYHIDLKFVCSVPVESIK